MSIDNNTLNFLNLKEAQVEDISTTSNNDNIFFNVILKRTDQKCPSCNLLTNKIKDILKSRRKDYLQNYLTKISIENRKKVKHVSIDMWETYRQMAYLYFSNAIVSIDSFHVIQDIERYVDKIRISFMNRYDKKSDQYYLLKEFGWLTKIKFSNIPNKEAKFNHRFNKYLTYSDIFNMIMEISNDLKDAYDWKEDYIRFNKNSTFENAPDKFNDLVCKLQKLNISFMNPIVNTLIKWKKEILNSFIRYDGLRISNGPIEGRNSTIKTIKKVSNGITNFNRFRNRIMFVINKDFYFDTNKKEIKKMR